MKNIFRPYETKIIETLIGGGGGNKTAQQKANLAKNKAKAKSLADARMKRKFSKGITGKKTGVA